MALFPHMKNSAICMFQKIYWKRHLWLILTLTFCVRASDSSFQDHDYMPAGDKGLLPTILLWLLSDSNLCVFRTSVTYRIMKTIAMQYIPIYVPLLRKSRTLSTVILIVIVIAEQWISTHKHILWYAIMGDSVDCWKGSRVHATKVVFLLESTLSVYVVNCKF